MVSLVFLVGLGIAAVLTLADNGSQLVVALLVLVPLLLLLILAATLLSLALRDFAAPVQMAAGVGCGAALRLVGDLVRAHPLAFFLYVVLKIVFGIAAGHRPDGGGLLHLLLHPHSRRHADVPPAAVLLRARVAALPPAADGL